MATNYEGDSIEFKDTIPLLPIRDIVVYPYMIIPLFVGRETSIEAVEQALAKNDRLILLASQKDITAESPQPSEIYDVGTLAMIMRMRKLPDGRIKILVQGLSKACIKEFVHTEPFYKVRIEKIEDRKIANEDMAVKALMRNLKEQLEKVITQGKMLSPDILMVLEDIHEAGRLADLVASNLSLHVAEAQLILETLDPIERLNKINEILVRELEIISMQHKIKSAARDEMSKTQKEYFLREQIKAIKSELGDEAPEINDEFGEFRDKLKKAMMPPDIERECQKQIMRLEKMHPDSSEASIIRNYLEWLVDLPWSASSEEILDLDYAQKVLDEDHFELEKVKERILEYLAVKTLKGKEMKGPILCFSGPPGVGKTSLGKSIARATGREFIRISLGGVKDEAEIRGHRRTYVGSMPGRVIQALKQIKTNNPVILLDEIDKMGGDFRGDPASALLEVLDPEQNHSFRDHYLNLSFNLSNVMFIATCNSLESIPAPLRDRLEILNLSGYSHEEKIFISKKFLIPKQMKENGLTGEHVEFSDDSIKTVISNHTYEAGLRNLERKIGALCRKVAMKIARGEISKTIISTDTVDKYLGPAAYSDEDRKIFDEVGVSTGLAWTNFGGQILYIESTKMKGKGITLTGQLGDVMKESAQAAMGHIRSRASEFGLDESIFEENEIHVHIPAGAIPKDGPSAGVTLATSIISLLTGLPVSRDVAMTGEITLTGKVLPIGGLKEKVLAALRMGLKTIVIPYRNEKDLVEIPEQYKKELKFVLAKTLDDVLETALVGWTERKKLFAKKSALKRPTTKSRDNTPPVAA